MFLLPTPQVWLLPLQQLYLSVSSLWLLKVWDCLELFPGSQWPAQGEAQGRGSTNAADLNGVAGMGTSAQTPAGVSLATHLQGFPLLKARLDLWEFPLKM